MSKRCYFSDSEQATKLIGRQIGSVLKGGEIIELSSDLGGGKTTLTKGIVEGIGSKDLVSSPTFTISNQYSSDKLTILHYDFYRLEELGLMADELKDVLKTDDTVTLIEWSGEAHDLIPKEKLVKVMIRPLPENESHRQIQLSLNDNLDYIYSNIEAIQC